MADQRKGKDTEGVFDRVFNNCEQFLYAEHKDILEFLDPVISDAQCQIHSVFIIGKLLQVYDKNGFPRYNFNLLSDVDKKLLSYVVLLCILKYEEEDEVGFVVDSRLVDDLGFFSGKVNAERNMINNLKATFNSCSIEHLKKVANGKIKDILNGCDASLNRTKFKLQLLPCYVSFYASFKYMEENDIPIILSLVRFNADSDGRDGRLSINSKSLLFYKFQKSEKAFVFKCKEDLSEEEKVQPALAFTCFSVVTGKCPEHYKEYMDGSQVPSEKFLTEDCDIRDLLMLYAAGHVQLTVVRRNEGPAGMTDERHTEEFVQQLYKLNSNESVKPGPRPFNGNFDLIEENVFGCYEFHHIMAEKFGIANTRYSYRTQSLAQSNMPEKTVLVNRRGENTFFSLDHVNVSTYARECDLLNSFTVGAEVPLVEPKSFKKTKARTFLESRLAKIKSF